MKRLCQIGTAGLLLGLGFQAGAQSPPPTVPTLTAPAAPKTASPSGGWQFSGSWRLRQEFWRWFPTPQADGEYTFTGSLLRAGIRRETSREEFVLELAQPALINLPTQASAPAPQGTLGMGAAYRNANRSQVANVFVKQGYIRMKNAEGAGNSLRLGRFEFSDGAELPAANPTLAYLKRERLAQRLLGPFAFSHVGRSFDGVLFARETPNHNVTALLAFPTRGVFSLRGMDTLTGVQIAYLSTTNRQNDRQGVTEGRLLGLYYADLRSGVVKTDNRPLPARRSDNKGIHMITLGGHLIRVQETGSGAVDGLFWGVGQFGDWGPLRHGAIAYAVEAGFQPKRADWNPWFRVGYYYASGDGDPNNRQHGSYFPVLPTPRLYARFPFFSEQNLEDLFLQVNLRPAPRLLLRTDLHLLRLADHNDLWYSGGGAFDNTAFGYTGAPGGGHRSLATLLDISADYQLTQQTALTLYVGYARAGSAAQAIFPGRDAYFSYIEALHRF